MKQLVTFFILAYFISWIIWLPLYGHIFGLNNIPALPYQHAIGALGPLLASFISTWIFLKKEGVKNLIAKCIQIKPLIYLAIALLSPFILAIIAMLISYFVNHTAINFKSLLHTKEFPQFGLFTFLFTIFSFLVLEKKQAGVGLHCPVCKLKWKHLPQVLCLQYFGHWAFAFIFLQAWLYNNGECSNCWLGF